MEFGPEIASEIIATCQEGASEIKGAFSRTFDGSVEIEIGEPGVWSPAGPPAGFDGPGLVLVFKLGEVGVLAMLPESSGLLPEWYAAPDATGRSKLGTLVGELGMILFPERLLAQGVDWVRAEGLSSAAFRCEVAAGATLLPVTLVRGEDRGAVLHLIWPAARAEEVLRGADQAAPTPAASPVEPSSRDTADESFSAAYGVEALPSYARSLLRIAVPLSVTLASKRQSVQSILQLGNGAIIQFEKSCDEMLDLNVGNQLIAKGEAVKVGDKFGIRITSFVFPDEQFVPLTREPQRNSQGGRSTVQRSSSNR